MLPNDVARCPGVSDEEGWREGCEDCMRRTTEPTGDMTWWMQPPSVIVFTCEYWIDPER